MYYHACGQPVELKEHHNGYCAWYLPLVDAAAVRHCPRCDKRIWVESLIYRRETIQEPAGWFEDYADQQDTLRCLEAAL